MHICNYCGRFLKHEYEKCPGCGASDFKNTAYLGETIIKEPPKGGYILNLKNYKKSMDHANIAIIIGIVFSVCAFIFDLPFLLIGLIEPLTSLAFILIPIVIGSSIIITGISNKNKTKKTMKRAVKLSKNGILVKNIPYEAVNTGTYIGNKYYKCIKVNYKNSAGVSIPLFSETKYDIDEKMKNDKTADLLIDPNDYSNYFIDFEIY